MYIQYRNHQVTPHWWYSGQASHSWLYIKITGGDFFKKKVLSPLLLIKILVLWCSLGKHRLPSNSVVQAWRLRHTFLTISHAGLILVWAVMGEVLL
jgi:hypothetical protein